MGNKSNDGRRFIMLPASLLPVLSNTALRIILYAIYRERLVELGYVDDWGLSLTDVHNRFGQLRGYALNTIRDGIRELESLNLLSRKGNYYDLNIDEIKKWLQKESDLGLPKSGKGGLPNSGRAGLPKSGSQEKRDKEKKSIREEREISQTPVAPAQPPVGRKSPEEQFDEIWPEAKGIKLPPKKTAAQFLDELICLKSAKEAIAPEASEIIPTVSGTAPQPPETLSPTNSGEPAQTTPPTDTERRQND
jgi:hypothetical protein